MILSRGVKKNRRTETGTGKPGNRGPGSGSGLKKPKTGYPGSGFWYPVFTGLPGTVLNIYFLYFF
jgi:hypothetical protein